MHTHIEVIYVSLTTVYYIRTPSLYMCFIKCISRGVCFTGELTKIHAENSIDIIHNSV